MPGPIPNRSSDLARPRERKGGNVQPVTKGVARPVTIPEADPEWHDIAKMLWSAMLESGQADFWQSSDYAFAYSVCEDLSLYKKPLTNKVTGEEYFKRSGQMLQTIYSAMGDLLVSEGARRRVRIELDSPEAEDESPTLLVMDDYRKGLGLSEEDANA